MRGYDTAEYAASRLNETIIMYKGEPVLVCSVGYGAGDNITVRCIRLLDDEEEKIEVLLEDCDINPVSLGYVNYKRNAHYIMRAPMRRDWRQGLRMLNLVDVEGASPRGIPYRTIAQTIIGKFPTFNSCLERLNSNDKTERMAYCRDFSVALQGALTYKGMIDVATVNMNNGTVKVNDNCSWVAEALDESMEVA